MHPQQLMLCWCNSTASLVNQLVNQFRRFDSHAAHEKTQLSFFLMLGFCVGAEIQRRINSRFLKVIARALRGLAYRAMVTQLMLRGNLVLSKKARVNV